MKNKTLTIIIIISTILLAVLSVFIVMRIKSLGTKPVAPSVPESKPEAVEETLPENPSVSSCEKTFIVIAPSVTPTSTPGPSSTPVPVPSATPTPTPGPSSTPTPTIPAGQSYCDYLKASPSSGTVPLTVDFTGKGHDTERIKGYRFTFGDGEKKEFLGSFTYDHIQEVEHTYTSSGTFTAKLEILDNGDHWRTTDQCQTTITVTGGVTVSPTKVPVTGGVTVSPTRIAQVNPTTAPTTVPQPTEVLLPQAGIKLPALGGIILGFLLISLGAVLVF